MVRLLIICFFSFIALSYAFDCTGKKDGAYKDPDNPHKFHQCTGGRTFNLDCPEDLVFDETVGVCVFGTETGAPGSTAKVTSPVQTTAPSNPTTGKIITPTVTKRTEPPTEPTKPPTKPPTEPTPKNPDNPNTTLRGRHTQPPY